MTIRETSEFKKIVVPIQVKNMKGAYNPTDVIITSSIRESYEKDEEGRDKRIYINKEDKIIKGHLKPEYVEMYVKHDDCYILVNIPVADLKLILAKTMEIESIEIQDTTENFNKRND